MKRIIISLSVLSLVFIGSGIEENKINAEEQLIITPMTYDKWRDARINAGFTPDMTRAEWINRGYYN